MHIEVFTFNPFQENTYLVWGEGNRCVVVDPGNSTPEEEFVLTEAIQERGLMPQAIWLTHAHADHVCGAAALVRRFQIPMVMHPADVKLLRDAPFFAGLFGFRMEPAPDPGFFMEEGHFMSLGESLWEVLHVPGHAPGHVVFIHHESRQVVAGDVLFRESIGRTDLPGGNFDLLVAGLKTKLLTLPEDYVVWPGHGPSTTIGHEKRYNPFLQ